MNSLGTQEDPWLDHQANLYETFLEQFQIIKAPEIVEVVDTETFCSKKKDSFECKICRKKFNYHQSLQEHILNHRKIRKYRCYECGESFTYRNQVYRHQYHLGHRGGAIRNVTSK